MPGAANFHSLPSGHSLRDAMKKLICRKYASRKGAKKKYDDIIEAWDDIPTGWWLEYHSIVHVLAVMVHRQSPTIIAAAAHAEPGPTRDEQRAAVAGSIAAERILQTPSAGKIIRCRFFFGEDVQVCARGGNEGRCNQASHHCCGDEVEDDE